MRTVKKFGDFFALLGALSALIHLLMQFFPFKTLEETSLFGKVMAFFSPSVKDDYFSFLVLCLLFLAVFLLAKLLPRFGSVHVAAALLPLGWSLFLLEEEHLGDRPMLYVVTAALYLVCSFADCLIRDREDEGNRSLLASRLCSVVTALFSLFVFFRACSVDTIPPEEWSFFDRAVGSAWQAGATFSAYWRLALMYALITVIGFLLKDIYFLEALIHLIPTVFVMLRRHAGSLPGYGSIVSALSVCCLLATLTLTFLGKPATPSPRWAQWRKWLAKHRKHS